MTRRKPYNGKSAQLLQLSTGDSEPFHFASTSTDGSSKGTKGVKRKRTTVNVVMVKEKEEDENEEMDHSKYDPYKRIPMENQWPVKQFLFRFKKSTKEGGHKDWQLMTQFENGVARLEDMNFGNDVDLEKIPTVTPEEFKKKCLVPVYKKQPTVYATPFCFYCRPRKRCYRSVYALRKHVKKKHTEEYEKHKNGIWRDRRKDPRTPENVGGRPKNSRNKKSTKGLDVNSGNNDLNLNEKSVNPQISASETITEDEDDHSNDNQSDEDETEDDEEMEDKGDTDESEDDAEEAYAQDEEDTEEGEDESEDKDDDEEEIENENNEMVQQQEKEEENQERTVSQRLLENVSINVDEHNDDIESGENETQDKDDAEQEIEIENNEMVQQQAKEDMEEENNQEILKGVTHHNGPSNFVEQQAAETKGHDDNNDEEDDDNSNRDSPKDNDKNYASSSISLRNILSVLKEFQIHDLQDLEENNSKFSPDCNSN